jgi:hypothetical protein
LWFGPAAAVRPELFQSVDHGIAPLVVYLTDLFDVYFENAALCHIIGDHLIEGAGVQVRSLFACPKRAIISAGPRPSDTESRRQRLGEGSQVDVASGRSQRWG